jgi:hypothetical protein
VIGWLRRGLAGWAVPPEFTLDAEENVLAIAEVSGGGHVMATSLGLWLPSGERVGWHLISKATWNSGVLAITPAEVADTLGGAVLIEDLPVRRFVLERPGTVPRVLRARVDGSIRSRHHHDLPGGGAWFVQRRVPGEDGVVLQVRADPGTSEEAVRRLATEVAARLG